MFKWDKLLHRIKSLSGDLRFDELKKVLEEYGYVMNAPRSGSSHYTFRKEGVTLLQFQNTNQLRRFMWK